MCCLPLHAAGSAQNMVRATRLDSVCDLTILVDGKDHANNKDKIGCMTINTSKDLTLRFTASTSAKIKGHAKNIYLDMSSPNVTVDLSEFLADDIVFVSKCDNVNISGLRAAKSIYFLQELRNHTNVNITTSQNIYFYKSITEGCLLRMKALNYVIGRGEVARGSTLYINDDVVLARFAKVDRSSRMELCELPEKAGMAVPGVEKTEKGGRNTRE